MKLSHIFERLILKFAQDRAAPKRTGRPRALTDTQVVGLLFKLLRTGCQWRELDCGEGLIPVTKHIQAFHYDSVTLEGGMYSRPKARAMHVRL